MVFSQRINSQKTTLGLEVSILKVHYMKRPRYRPLGLPPKVKPIQIENLATRRH